MKKRLLFAALAMVCASSVFAYEEGEYAFTSSGRVKTTSGNMVINGTFSDAGGTTGWTNAEGGAVSGQVWAVEPGVGENGEDAIKSLGTVEGEDGSLCQVLSLDPGTYLVSYQIRATGETLSGSTSVASPTNNNYADVFINTTGELTKVDTSDDAPVVTVAAAQNFSSEWTTVNYFCTVEEGQFLVIRFETMATDILLTNISVNAADAVYDIRIANRMIEYAKMLAHDSNFDIAEAAGAREYLLSEVIPTIEGMIEANALDEISQAEDIINGLKDALADFLDCSSQNLKEQIKGIDISTLGYAGRGRTITGLGNSDEGGVWLEGGNWGHITPAEGEDEYLMSAIQNGNWTHTAKYCIADVTFPAGKYFFTAEIRNAYTGGDSWPCPGQVFNLNTTCQISIGETTQDIENVVGEEYKRVYLVAEIAEDGKFTASIFWPGDDRTGSRHGGAFYIRNVEVRTFVMDAEERAAHMAAWNTFIVQYNAAVSARNSIVSMQSDKNYPWNRQILQEALDTYDPLFHITDGWVSSDGRDAGLASTDQLNEWAAYQGGEVPEDGKATYTVVRGYQAAINAMKQENIAISNLISEISKAYAIMADGMYSDGNKSAFMTAITGAQNILDKVLSDADDASKEEDVVTLETALSDLQQAIEAFKASSNIMPMVDIDFSNGFEENGGGYVIKGAAGEMNFTVVQTDPTVNDYSFALGIDVNGELQLGDVLHVGGDSYGEVIFPEVVNDGDGLKITFDFWYGQLGKAFQYIDLVNASGERVAGFSYDSYNSNVEYNEFNNDENTGMNIRGNVRSNHDKNGGAASVCTDALRNSFELNIDYKNNTIQGSFVNSSKQITGIDLEINTTEGFDNKIAAFRVGGRGHAKANSGAFGRRAWFDNLKIFKFTVPGASGDVNGDTSVDVADISAIISVMAGTAQYANADVNGDGSVDVADISTVITIMANN